MSAAVLDLPIFQKLAKIPVKTVCYWLAVVFSIWSLYLLAKLTWYTVELFLSDVKVERPQVEVSTAAPRRAKPNIRVVARASIFGEEMKDLPVKAVPEKVPLKEVKKSSLNVKLRAVYVSENRKSANATLEIKPGQQEVLFIGDKFSGGAELLEVHPNQIIISRNGSTEAILMEEFAPSKGGIATYSRPGNFGRGGGARKIDKRNDRMASRELRRLRTEFKSNPAAISQFITGSEHMVNGEFVGFKIRPGRNRRLFNRLGLKRDDVVTSINGTALSNMQAAMTMMGQIDSVEELSLTVLRGGEEVTLQFSVAE